MEEFKIKQKIIGFFDKKREKFVSGEEISDLLGFSRAYLWKHINKLREEGYEIEAVPHLGYRLKRKPDKVYGYEIPHKIKTKSFGKNRIYHYETIASTNDKAYELAEKGGSEGTIVVAETQTSGKGRMGRIWVSPKCVGLYMSIILRPDLRADEVTAINLVAGVSVASAINKISLLDAKIKWPNDVFIKDRKVAGVLAEMKAQPDKVEFLVLGIGINLNTSLKKLPEIGTSLKHEGSKNIDRTEFMAGVLAELEKNYITFQKEGFKALRKTCKKMSNVLGEKIKITDHGRIVEGVAKDIDTNGSLIVRCDNGRLERIFSGDVTLKH